MNRRIPSQAVICQNKYLLLSSLNTLFPFLLIPIDVKPNSTIFIYVDIIQKLFLIASKLYPFIFSTSKCIILMLTIRSWGRKNSYWTSIHTCNFLGMAYNIKCIFQAAVFWGLHDMLHCVEFQIVPGHQPSGL